MDIALNWDPRSFRADWIIRNGTFLMDAGLHSVILVSLFTDRTAPPDWVPPAGGSTDRRGWWGDTYGVRPVGSWLWLLNRVKKSDQITIPNRARDYCQLALQWLIDEGIAASVTIQSAWITPDTLGISGVVTRPNGRTVPFSFPWLWMGA